MDTPFFRGKTFSAKAWNRVTELSHSGQDHMLKVSDTISDAL
jgi:hypothetical protein